MNKANIWIVDDEPAICWSLRRALEPKGHSIHVFSNAESAIRELEKLEIPCNLLVTDLRLPGCDGFALTQSARKIRGRVPIIMITAFGDLETAVHAMKSEVFDYLTKPFDLHDALASIDRALAVNATSDIAQDFQHSIGETLLLGNSAAMQFVYKQIAIASRTRSPIFIVGPEGSPCESVAAAIHKHSDDSTLPFLPIAPTSISLSQLEREFMGVFSGAIVDAPRTGVLGLVGSGTLYIDEVADLTKSLQVQLYRVLDTGTYVPFGSAESFPFLGRIITSSTRNMGDLAEQEGFDKRLAERLAPFTISIPPLNTRSEDILSIANAILRFRRDKKFEFSREAEVWLQKEVWIGDVRQLRNTLECAMAMHTGGVIHDRDLIRADEQLQAKWRPPKLEAGTSKSPISAAIDLWLQDYLSQNKVSRDPPSSDDFGILYEEFLSVVEPPMIEGLFRYLQGNRAATAAILGMHRSTLRQKMRRYGLD